MARVHYHLCVGTDLRQSPACRFRVHFLGPLEQVMVLFKLRTSRRVGASAVTAPGRPSMGLVLALAMLLSVGSACHHDCPAGHEYYEACRSCTGLAVCDCSQATCRWCVAGKFNSATSGTTWWVSLPLTPDPTRPRPAPPPPPPHPPHRPPTHPTAPPSVPPTHRPLRVHRSQLHNSKKEWAPNPHPLLLLPPPLVPTHTHSFSSATVVRHVPPGGTVATVLDRAAASVPRGSTVHRAAPSSRSCPARRASTRWAALGCAHHVTRGTTAPAPA
jgi:hypothetical protein